MDRSSIPAALDLSDTGSALMRTSRNVRRCQTDTVLSASTSLLPSALRAGPSLRLATPQGGNPETHLVSLPASSRAGQRANDSVEPEQNAPAQETPAEEGSIASTEPKCTICQEPYDSGLEPETPVTLACGHTFGSVCVTQWLHVGDRSHKCPLCRQKLFRNRRTVTASFAVDAGLADLTLTSRQIAEPLSDTSQEDIPGGTRRIDARSGPENRISAPATHPSSLTPGPRIGFRSHLRRIISSADHSGVRPIERSLAAPNTDFQDYFRHLALGSGRQTRPAEASQPGVNVGQVNDADIGRAILTESIRGHQGPRSENETDTVIREMLDRREPSVRANERALGNCPTSAQVMYLTQVRLDRDIDTGITRATREGRHEEAADLSRYRRALSELCRAYVSSKNKEQEDLLVDAIKAVLLHTSRVSESFTLRHEMAQLLTMNCLEGHVRGDDPSGHHLREAAAEVAGLYEGLCACWEHTRNSPLTLVEAVDVEALHDADLGLALTDLALNLVGGYGEVAGGTGGS